MIPDASFPTINGFGQDKSDPKALAAKVQAMFLEVMLKTMEDSVGAEGGLFGGGANSEIYRGMFREQLATAISAKMGGHLEQELQEDMGDEQTNSNSLSPVPAGVVTSEIGWRQDPFTGHAKFHKGIDIAAPAGTNVNAVADGTVVESGVKGSFGNTVVIQADDGRRMLYAHNQQNFVRVGDRVVRGDAIAQVGSTGRATGPHVHFEILE